MIENYERLASTPLRKQALDVLIAGIAHVMPGNFMPAHVSSDGESIRICGDVYDLSHGNLYVIGGGKASGAMAVELEKIVQPTAGIVNDQSVDFATRWIEVHSGGHPIPTAEGVAGVRKMLELTSRLTARDFVICLISGGGSSLMTYPVEGVELDDIRELTDLVLKAGLNIREINILRKHLSQVAGGKLARYLQPARVIGLIVADTLNPEQETASGPTSVDPSTFEEAYAILRQYGLVGRSPARIVDYIRKGLRCEVAGTVHSPAEFAAPVHNYVLADNAAALAAMRRKATAESFETQLYPEPVSGEAREAASSMGRFYRLAYARGGNAAVIAGGETTVTVKGSGRGGRNQEYVAATIREIKDCRNAVVASIGTDGVDFLPGIGGAIITDSAFDECRTQGLRLEEYLQQNNTYALHERLRSLIEMKPTHTNVADICVFLTRESR